MKTIRLSRVLLAVVLPLVTALSFAGAAEASPPPGRTVLLLTVTTPEGPPQAAALACEPSGGTHPAARAACWELRVVNGNFDALPGHQEPVACTMEFRPVTATADGTWRGKQVSWRQEFSNPCVLRASTGRVFRF